LSVHILGYDVVHGSKLGDTRSPPNVFGHLVAMIDDHLEMHDEVMAAVVVVGEGHI